MALWKDSSICVRPVSSASVHATARDKDPKGPEKGTQWSFRGGGHASGKRVSEGKGLPKPFPSLRSKTASPSMFTSSLAPD
jgi:hypothetical protein